ncbi:MAG: aminotransferase class III-fold pyridoxal phosphate-dependent enzyme [Pseudomonadota bacterium]
MRKEIYDAFMTGPDYAIEFFHGYTYSGHPMAAAAAHATLDVMQEEGLIERARYLEPALEEAVHALREESGVADVRNIGLAAAIDLEPWAGQPGRRALQVFEAALRAGLMLRYTGDTLAMAPPFIASKGEIVRMADILRGVLRASN